MCDCYEAKCEKCERLIPVHIEDFCTPRDNVKVFCQHHIPKNLPCTIEELQPENKHIPAELRGLKRVAFHIVDRENYSIKEELDLNYKYQPTEQWEQMFPEEEMKETPQEKAERVASRTIQYMHPSEWASINAAGRYKVLQKQFGELTSGYREQKRLSNSIYRSRRTD